MRRGLRQAGRARKRSCAPAANEAGAAASRQTTPPEAESRPKVVFQTSAGSFTVELHRDKVQRTVDNFLRYVDTRFYDGTLFHEVIANYAVVGGGYTAGQNGQELIEKQGLESIRNESETGLSNVRGRSPWLGNLTGPTSRSMPVLYKP